MPIDLPILGVSQVVDGDTVALQDGRRIRLIGLNTPEMGYGDKNTEKFALAAQQRVQRIVAASGGRVFVQEGKESADKYGRTLAHLYDVQGRNIEEQLLVAGLGYAVSIAPNLELRECLWAAERRARDAHIGVWRESPVQPAAQISSAGFALVSGRILSVKTNRGGTWLEMDDSLVLNIAPALRRAFAPLALDTWVGRQIEVRGWVVDRSADKRQKNQARWLLPVTDPAMLTVQE